MTPPFKIVNKTGKPLFLQVNQDGNDITIEIREDAGNVQLTRGKPEVFKWTEWEEFPKERIANMTSSNAGHVFRKV